ncbi:MAG TPA: hypothetical protein PK395_20170, partial [bacterium]|nr:hypothetical protein [bacterium]
RAGTGAGRHGGGQARGRAGTGACPYDDYWFVGAIPRGCPRNPWLPAGVILERMLRFLPDEMFRIPDFTRFGCDGGQKREIFA